MNITIHGPICVQEAASLFLDIIEKDYSEDYRDEIEARGFKRTFIVVGAKVSCSYDGPVRYTCPKKRSYKFYWK